MQYSPTMYKKLKKVIVKHPKEAFISQAHLHNEWKPFNYIEEPDFEASLQEYETFMEILKKHVDEVLYLPEDDTVGLDSIYAHDPVKFTDKGAIILNPGKDLRKPEAKAYRTFLEENNIPIIGELTGDAIADGGDLVWIDDKTLAIGRGYRTNDEGIRQIKEITKDIVEEHIVVDLPHDLGREECLHLMSLISIVDKDLAVVYSPLMAVSFRNYLIDKGFTLVETPKEEYDQLGSNVLALAPRICMMVEGNNETKEALERQGATVYTYKGNEISYKGTGGPTCLTSPVVRQ